MLILQHALGSHAQAAESQVTETFVGVGGLDGRRTKVSLCLMTP